MTVYSLGLSASWAKCFKICPLSSSSIFFESRVTAFNCSFEFIIPPEYIPLFRVLIRFGADSDAASIMC